MEHVKVEKVEEKYRIVDAETGLVAVNAGGKPLDGGGHDFEDKAQRQVGYINAGLEKKRNETQDQ
jgi:hypothetical protein